MLTSRINHPKNVMRALTLILFIVVLPGCDNSWRIQATWEVTELSQYPLSITDYGDAKLDKGSRLWFDNQGQLHIFLTDTTRRPETFNYVIQDDDIIMWYSDYGIPLTINNLNDDELELEIDSFKRLIFKKAR
jgi:hypothetical protein